MLAYSLNTEQLSSLCKPTEVKFRVSLLSRVGGWVELQPHILEPQPHIGWGEIEIKANSAQLELELGLSLATMN